MSKFKVGDTVRVILETDNHYEHVGSVGIVVDKLACPEDTATYLKHRKPTDLLVEFDPHYVQWMEEHEVEAHNEP